MMKSSSPCLTSAPSVKATLSIYPETRGRTSTVSSLPVYSSHSGMRFSTTLATLTSGGGAAPADAPPEDLPQAANPRHEHRTQPARMPGEIRLLIVDFPPRSADFFEPAQSLPEGGRDIGRHREVCTVVRIRNRSGAERRESQEAPAA